MSRLDDELEKEAPNVLRLVNGQLSTFDERNLSGYLTAVATRLQITDKTPVVIITRQHFINIVKEKRLLQARVNALLRQLHGD